MNLRTLGTLLSFAILFSSTSCKKDDDKATGTFKVTIENILSDLSYLSSGATDAIPPDNSLEISFDAGKGHYLSFATMLVQSNDLFYAPAPNGIRLYDDSGNALTGNITDQIDLWDAGTEVNQEPGVGADQAPRQSGPNTGADENGTVELIENVTDGYTYPANDAIIRAELSHDGGTRFTLTLTNLSGSSSLPTPLAPGVYVIHGAGTTPLFEEGAASSAGLESLAEDGGNTTLADELAANTGYTSPFAPGVFAVHNADVSPFFNDGTADRGAGLEALSEDGSPDALNGALSSISGISSFGVFNTPTGASDAGALLPGNSYEFTVDAEEGDYWSFATMLVHTNDLFYAFDDNGIAFFDTNGNPISGDVTADVSLWDAGTEVNEYPGAGNNQPARGGADSGPAENGNVQVVNDGFTYPAVNSSIRVRVTAQ